MDRHRNVFKGDHERKTVCRTLPLMIVSLFATLAMVGLTTVARGQCNGQDVLDCDCDALENVDINVCIAGQTGTITLKVCNQFPSPNLIRNPCQNCQEPLNAITWVNEICIPPIFSGKTYAELLPGIICATSLCKVPNFLGAAIPECVPTGALACQTTNPYCHVLSIPRCVRKEGTCWKSCDEENCDNRCMVWRKYCADPALGCVTCGTTSTCTYNATDVCPTGCEQLDDCPFAHPSCCL